MQKVVLYSMAVVFEIPSMLSADLGISYRHCTRWPWEIQHSSDFQKECIKTWTHWSIVDVQFGKLCFSLPANSEWIAAAPRQPVRSEHLPEVETIYAGCLLWHSQRVRSKKLGHTRALQRWIPFSINCNNVVVSFWRSHNFWIVSATYPCATSRY